MRNREGLLLANNIQQDLLHRLSSTMGLEPRDPVSLSYFSQRSAQKDDPSPSNATESLLRAAQYIAELANESVSNPRESALVTDVLRQAIASIDDRARSKSITIAAIPPVDVSVTGNAAILAEAFAIYFIKAIDWSAPGSRIEILFEVGNGRFITMLHSTGMFVPREELFETFDLRTELAPTIPLDLGPPLARKVIEVFGGQLALDSMDDGIFQMIELPTAPTD